MLPRGEVVPASFYGRAYFEDGTISGYGPYGPGQWADWLAEMIVEYLAPSSVLDIGCAYGYVIERLRQKGIAAAGFDISEYALEHAVMPEYMWLGDAADPSVYPGGIDLAFSSEMGEHLAPRQVRIFLVAAYHSADRLLLLTAMDDAPVLEGTNHGDHSHINVQSHAWWEQEARTAGWVVGDASRFNEDQRSVQMLWAGRFMFLQKET
jgi:SAM-dependent methyltransferase